MSARSYRIKFIADEAFNNAVKSFAKVSPTLLKVESEHSERDATRLGFDLQKIAEIVTLIAESFSIAELATRVFAWLNQSKANKVIIQTPFTTVEVHKAKDLSEEEVRRILKQAMEM